MATNHHLYWKFVAVVMGKCEACHKPWDMYRGKRRCPTCGVPSLICRECFLADKEGRKKLGREVRCDLCVEQGIRSKHELRQRDQQEIEEYEQKMKQKGFYNPKRRLFWPPIQIKSLVCTSRTCVAKT
jgi:hypothetical protein